MESRAWLRGRQGERQGVMPTSPGAECKTEGEAGKALFGQRFARKVPLRGAPRSDF